MLSLETDAARCRSLATSGATSAEYVELSLVTRLSLLSLVLRLKMALPMAWTLSGRSREGMLLVVDLIDDFLESENESRACSQEGRRSTDA